MSQVALFGVFGVGNLGNDATLAVMVHHLRQRLPQSRLVCVCTDPEQVQARYAIDAVPIDTPLYGAANGPANKWLRRANRVATRGVAEVKLWRATIGRFQKDDHLVIAGTGVLDDFGVQPWNLPYDLFKWCTAARQAGARVSFASAGAGPIERSASRWLMLSALRRAGYRSYRDQMSKDYLQRIGFDSAQDAVYPDLVFSWPDATLPECGKPATPPRIIGVGVMGYYGWRNQMGQGEEIYRTYYAKLRTFVAWLLAQGYQVRLIIGETPTDLRPVQELLAEPGEFQAAQQTGQLSAPAIADPAGVLEAIAGTDLLVATRFHNVVSAFILGRPVLSIGYSKKNDALLADMGLGAFCQQVDTFDLPLLQQQFQQLVEYSAQAAPLIVGRVDEYRRQLSSQYDQLFGGAATQSASSILPAAQMRSYS